MNSTNKTKIEDKFTVEAQMEMIRKAIRKDIRKMMKQRLNMKPHLYVFDKYIEADTWVEVKQKATEYLKELYPE